MAELDVRGMICPLPVLRARKALAAMAPGDLLRVYCTDPAAAADFPAYCQAANHTLMEAVRQELDHGPELIFLIRRGD
ncbi:MAG: sulfurtransferase TusA family protein [Proteobacteria bacterium]|nr:sulfurtransferase TusA family protein [Pseudomonadota bacterium]